MVVCFLGFGCASRRTYRRPTQSFMMRSSLCLSRTSSRSVCAAQVARQPSAVRPVYAATRPPASLDLNSKQFRCSFPTPRDPWTPHRCAPNPWSHWLPILHFCLLFMRDCLFRVPSSVLNAHLPSSFFPASPSSRFDFTSWFTFTK